MPILPGGGGVPGFSQKATTTVQNIIDIVVRDASRELAGELPQLIDWTNRIHLEILRRSRWEFLRSDANYFMTRKGVTDYFIGVGSQPAGTYNTGLGLADVDYIKKDSVIDRSNSVILGESTDFPPRIGLTFPDYSDRLSRPREWQYSNNVDPYVLRIFPAPDNQNIYKPVPQPPGCTYVAAGSLASRIYYVRLTYLDSVGGESTTNQSTRTWVPANNVLKVRSPEPILQVADSGITYNRYRVYVGTADGSETLQATVNIGTDWIEPTSGLVVGAAWPTTPTIEQMGGYLIEFIYFRIRQQLDSTNDILQVPDDYRDVVAAGVSWLLTRYLKSKDEAAQWYTIYQKGIAEIVRDKNLVVGSGDFIRPDMSSQSVGYSDGNVPGW